MEPNAHIPPPEPAFSFQRLAHILICLCIVLYVLYAGSSFFIPITYGIFFALMLRPVVSRFERQLGSRVVAIVLALLTVGLAVAGVIYFFIDRVQAVLREANDIISGLIETKDELVYHFAEFFGLQGREAASLVDESVINAVSEPFGIITTGLSTTSILMANVAIVLIYAFLFLLYRTAFRNFVLSQLSESTQAEGVELLEEVQKVAVDYLGGMGVVMLILGVMNSLGLYFIGVDYPLVWGFLAAMLAVIPYVGTVIGGLLPFLYAVATLDTLWQPVAVVVLYGLVQFLEGNLITPRVVGRSVQINALAAILGIILGGMLWGLAGIVIAIPLLAIVRIILKHIEYTKPIALLLSDEVYEHANDFTTIYNEPKYRISQLFQRNGPALRPVRRLKKKVPQQVGQADPQVIADAEAEQTRPEAGRQLPPVAEGSGHLGYENRPVEGRHGTQNDGIPVQIHQPTQQQVEQRSPAQGQGREQEQL